MKRLVAVGCACWLVLGSGRDVEAHDLRPGVLSMAETAAGVYELRVTAPVDSRGDAVELTIELPAGCARDGDRVRCAGALAGTLTVRGMRGDAMRTIVRIERLDGGQGEWIASAGAPQVQLWAAPPNSRLLWLRIGIEHIFGGLDHLAFVLGLLLVLGGAFDRRLLLTISAFTVAHSLTLALAVFGWIEVPIAPVEACIAASVLLVAREATHRQPTVIRRWPWLAAAGFGLIHGLGFASALGELGLPRDALLSSLLWFNLGVELGQLAIVSAVLLLGWLVRRVIDQPAPRVHPWACYLLGGVAAWWLVERVAIIAGGGS